MKDDIKKFNHGDRVIINNRRGHIFTVAGYAKEYNEDPVEAVNRAVKNGHRIFCINQEPAILTSDEEYNKKRRQEWEKSPVIEDGEIIDIEDNLLVVDYKGNYSDMAHLKYFE